MKKTQPKTALNMAFNRINSVVGEDLDEVVKIIEKHGRKKKLKRVSKQKVKPQRVLAEA